MVVKGRVSALRGELPEWKLRWGARRGFSTGGGLNRLLKKLPALSGRR
jgi:uncharacterized protein (DUF3820 family)